MGFLVVLVALTEDLFKHVHRATPKDLMLKVLFLLATASARRVSEIHALCIDPPDLKCSCSRSFLGSLVAHTNVTRLPFGAAVILSENAIFKMLLLEHLWFSFNRSIYRCSFESPYKSSWHFKMYNLNKWQLWTRSYCSRTYMGIFGLVMFKGILWSSGALALFCWNFTTLFLIHLWFLFSQIFLCRHKSFFLDFWNLKLEKKKRN